MCTTCGCNGDGATLEHHHPHHPGDHMPHHHGPHGEVVIESLVSPRHLAMEQDLLARNDAIASGNRQRFAETGTLALNLLSSPGAGKTTLLVNTIERLTGRWPVAVIEGDQQTSLDAERIRATGAPATQINTGKGCHLDARMVADALPHLPLRPNGLLLIENVGNLVCPAAFDLGEAHKVVVFSVTEGEDKPLKYPDMFRAADLVLLNKCDLLPYLAFDVNKAIACAKIVKPGIKVIQISATSDLGMDAWLDWLDNAAAQARDAAAAKPAY